MRTSGQVNIHKIFLQLRTLPPLHHSILHHLIPPPLHHSTDKMDQAFPLHFCILQAIKNWTVGRPGNKATITKTLSLQQSSQFCVCPTVVCSSTDNAPSSLPQLLPPQDKSHLKDIPSTPLWLAPVASVTGQNMGCYACSGKQDIPSSLASVPTVIRGGTNIVFYCVTHIWLWGTQRSEYTVSQIVMIFLVCFTAISIVAVDYCH